MPADPHTPKFQMPCVYRPKNEKVFRCKVGYALDKHALPQRWHVLWANSQFPTDWPLRGHE